jgi:hypothetical protein
MTLLRSWPRVRVQFKVAEEAVMFAERFLGRVL